MARSRRGGTRHGAGSYSGQSRAHAHHPATHANADANYNYNTRNSNIPTPPGHGAGVGASSASFGSGIPQPPPDHDYPQNDAEGDKYGQYRYQQTGSASRTRSRRARQPPHPHLNLIGEQRPGGGFDAHSPEADARSPMDVQSPHSPANSLWTHGWMDPASYAPENGTDAQRAQFRFPCSPVGGGPVATARGGNYQPQRVPNNLRPPPPVNYASPPSMSHGAPFADHGPPPPAYDVASPPPYSIHHQPRQSMGKPAVSPGGRRGGRDAARPGSPRGEKPSSNAGVPDKHKAAPPPSPGVSPRSGGGGFGPAKGKKTCFVILGVVVLVLLGVGVYYLVKYIEGKSAENVDRSPSKDAPLPGHGEKHTGDMTYYDAGLGSCGLTSTNGDAICAISHVTYDAAQQGGNPNTNPLCGKKIRIERDDRTVDVTVVDRCEACKADDLDLAPAVFEKLADMSQGRVQAAWAWLDH